MFQLGFQMLLPLLRVLVLHSSAAAECEPLSGSLSVSLQAVSCHFSSYKPSQFDQVSTKPPHAVQSGHGLEESAPWFFFVSFFQLCSCEVLKKESSSFCCCRRRHGDAARLHLPRETWRCGQKYKQLSVKCTCTVCVFYYILFILQHLMSHLLFCY